MMVLDAYNAEKQQEANENLAKFREEQQQIRTEFVMQMAQENTQKATDYIVTTENLNNLTPEELVRKDTIVGEIVTKQESLYKALQEIQDINSKEWQTALTKFIADKEAQISKHELTEKGARTRADKYDAMGSGVDRKERDRMWELAKVESRKAWSLKHQIEFIKKLFKGENSPEAIKKNLENRKGICTIENKSAEVLAWEEKTGLSIVAKKYAPDDIDYDVLMNGKIVDGVGNSEYIKSHQIYILNNDLVFDKKYKEDDKQRQVKFVLNEKTIEQWYKDLGNEWKKSKIEFEISKKNVVNALVTSN